MDGHGADTFIAKALKPGAKVLTPKGVGYVLGYWRDSDGSHHYRVAIPEMRSQVFTESEVEVV